MNSPAQNLSNEKPKRINSRTTKDEEFDQALDRVYRQYGSDLSAFIRDVQRDMQKIQYLEESQSAEPDFED